MYKVYKIVKDTIKRVSICGGSFLLNKASYYNQIFL